MCKVIVTAVIAVLLSGPAFAACDFRADVQPLGCGVVPQTGWNPFASVALSAEELAAQDAANAAWREEAYHRARAERRDGNLSVYFAAQDWNGTVGGGKNPNPTGGQIGAGIGD